MTIAALILGIAGFPLIFFAPLLGTFAGIAGLILALRARKNQDDHTVTTVALILNAVVLAIAQVLLVKAIITQLWLIVIGEQFSNLLN
ncbi:MAG: hypothetical protein IJA77_04340 [Clostridia bacterium]|nr:hypothetical protein [Clostridia bacterium]